MSSDSGWIAGIPQAGQGQFSHRNMRIDKLATLGLPFNPIQLAIRLLIRIPAFNVPHHSHFSRFGL
jgi:hypothetical protein